MSSATATLDSDVPESSEPRHIALRPSRRVLVGLGSAALVASIAAYVALTWGHVSTDDAQVDADIVAVPSQTTGTVAEIFFTDDQRVRAGDLLVRLDDTEARAKVDEATANLASAEAAALAAHADVNVIETHATSNLTLANASLRTASAAVAGSNEGIAEADASRVRAQANLEQANADLARMTSLRNSGSISDAQFDQTQTAARVAQANLDASNARLATLRTGVREARGHVAEASARREQASSVDVQIAQARARSQQADAMVGVARARLELAKVTLGYTRIVAPADGVVSRRSVQVGQLLGPGTGIVQLVRDTRWITANFKETQVEDMRVGQAVRVSIDAFPDAEVWARVESISGATGSRFALLPPDNASGNFTKVVQRVPVRLRVGALPSGVSLLPGMNVDVTVHTRSHS